MKRNKVGASLMFARYSTGLWLMAVAFLMCLPFFAVNYPPITDLPQQLVQIRFFVEAWQDPESQYVVHYLSPNKVGYLLVGLFWSIFPPAEAGRAVMIFLILLLVTSFFAFSKYAARSVPTAIFGLLFLWSPPLHWGFFNFLLGIPAFFLFLSVIDRDIAKEYKTREGLFFLGTMLLLYFSHVFWLFVAIVWLVASSFSTRKSRALLFFRLMWLSPVLILTVTWMRDFYSTRFVTPVESPLAWRIPPVERLTSYDWWQFSAMGGIDATLSLMMFFAFLVWLGIIGMHYRDRILGAIDYRLLVLFLVFFVAAVVLPYRYGSTVLLADRWVPVAFIFLAFSMPIVSRNSRLLYPLYWLVPVVSLGAFSFSATIAWSHLEREEFSGLSESIQSLPENQRLIGLYSMNSQYVSKWRPFMHVAAYAQVIKGGTMHFSFANLASSLVTLRYQEKPPWTRKLEWYPWRVKPEDFKYFDYLLMGATSDVHQYYQENSQFEPVTTDGRWRLYKINPLNQELPDGSG